MPATSALIAGSTGLIGSYLLAELLQDGNISRIHGLTRQPEVSDAKRLIWHQFAEVTKSRADFNVDDVYITLGTTMKKAGSRAAFEQVDRHLVRQVAQWGLDLGAKRLMVVSSLGANEKSLFYYSRVKGIMEQEVCRPGYEQVHIFRPSILDGPRQEKRFAEQLTLRLFRVVNPLLAGPFKTYRSIHASVVAKAMLLAGTTTERGIHVYSSADIAAMGAAGS